MPLSRICQARVSAPTPSFSANAAPRARSSSVIVGIVDRRRRELQPRDEMAEFGELDQHLRRVGAGVDSRLCDQREAPADVALHDAFEQIDDLRRGRRGRASRECRPRCTPPAAPWAIA